MTLLESFLKKALNGSLYRLAPAECMSAYAVNFQTYRGNLILVSNGNGKLASPRLYNNYASAIAPGFKAQCTADPFDWICGSDAAHQCYEHPHTICPVAVRTLNHNDWRPLGNTVSYSISDAKAGRYKLHFSTAIAAVVIAFNACKALVLFAVWLFVQEEPLVTMGDAVSSFVRKRDDITVGLCSMTRDRVESLWSKNLAPRPYTRGKNGSSRRWSKMVSGPRWACCMLLYASSILLCFCLLLYGTVGRPVPSNTLISLPIGSLNPVAFIYGWTVPNTGLSSILSNVLIANLPQVILSVLYYTYNSLFTCFFAGLEWSAYAMQRRGRVSSAAHGEQRASNFLQLPYPVAATLMIISGILHWPTSQGIFLVSVQEQAEGSDTLSKEFVTCGYSPPATLAVVLIGVAMVTVAWCLGRMKFGGEMPIAGRRSASISAMCHLPIKEEEDDAAYQLLQWGITGGGKAVRERDGAIVSHCSFSSRPVRLPKEGELSAGNLVNGVPRRH